MKTWNTFKEGVEIWKQLRGALQEVGLHKNLPMALLPETSYRKTLDSRFTLDQTTYTVSACPGNAFRRFIRECGQVSLKNEAWKSAHLEKLMFMLDADCSDVARWYALNILLEHKVVVPLEIN